jgi:hypothetical protein
LAIRLKVKYKDPNKPTFTMPVASQSNFRDFWLPVCDRLELEMLPLFNTGYPVIKLNSESIPALITELQRFQAFILVSTPDAQAENIGKTVKTIIDLLHEVQQHWNEIEWVGV